jgi:hypothetical protein
LRYRLVWLVGVIVDETLAQREIGKVITGKFLSDIYQISQNLLSFFICASNILQLVTTDTFIQGDTKEIQTLHVNFVQLSLIIVSLYKRLK